MNPWAVALVVSGLIVWGLNVRAYIRRTRAEQRSQFYAAQTRNSDNREFYEQVDERRRHTLFYYQERQNKRSIEQKK